MGGRRIERVGGRNGKREEEEEEGAVERTEGFRRSNCFS